MIAYCTCGHVDKHHQRAATWLPVNVCTWKGCHCVNFHDADAQERRRAS